MKAIPIKVAADICGLEERQLREAHKDGALLAAYGLKVRLSDVCRIFELAWDTETCTFQVDVHIPEDK